MPNSLFPIIRLRIPVLQIGHRASQASFSPAEYCPPVVRIRPIRYAKSRPEQPDTPAFCMGCSIKHFGWFSKTGCYQDIGDNRRCRTLVAANALTEAVGKSRTSFGPPGFQDQSACCIGVEAFKAQVNKCLCYFNTVSGKRDPLHTAVDGLAC